MLHLLLTVVLAVAAMEGEVVPINVSFFAGGDVVAVNTMVSPLFLLFCFLASGQDPPASRWPSGALVPGNIHIDLSPSSPEQAETKRVVGNFL